MNDQPFSVRMGYEKEKQPQTESLDDKTRVGLHELFINTMPEQNPDEYAIWSKFFKHFLGYEGKSLFLAGENKLLPEREKDLDLFFRNENWCKILNLIEWIDEKCFEPMDDIDPDAMDIVNDHNYGVYVGNKYFRKEVNNFLLEYNVGYSFIEGKFAPLGNKAGALAVQEALESPSEKVRRHIGKAIDSLDRNKPEYPNCIKESIFAIEGVLSEITGENEFGKSCNWLENKKVRLHPQFVKAMRNFYQFTSDMSDIRHSKDEKGVIKQELDREAAVCMLGACSAIAHYLAVKAPQLRKGEAADDDNIPF